MKKLLIFALALLLCIQPIAVMAETLITATAPAKLPFKDVPEGWYYDGVKTAYELGLVNGKDSPDTYKPDENMSYAEAIKLAACMHQLYTTKAVTLTNGTANWYDTYVEYCKTNGIISKEYDYKALATRSGYMEIFAKALPDEALAQTNSVPDDSIPDVKMDAAYAAAVYKLYRAGIVGGVDADHNCAPTSNIKRSEVAVILARMMVKENRQSFSISKPIEVDKPTAEDEAIYNRYKVSIEKAAKSFAETAAIESLTSSYSTSTNSIKVVDSDPYFRYVIAIDITNSSITGSEQLSFMVMIRVPTAMDTYEIGKITSSKISDEAKAEFGWGKRPADFGVKPEE